MTFRSDLERFVGAEIMRTTDTALASNLRRLLRGENIGRLVPIDASGYPAELREARPGARGTIQTWIFMESGLVTIDGAASVRYTSELIADVSADQPYLDWLFYHGIMLTFQTRNYTEDMTSIANPTGFVTGNYGCHSGKMVLLWQSKAGTNEAQTPS